MALVLRLVKGSELTYQEGDDNLVGLSNGSLWDLVALAALDVGFGDLTVNGDLLVTGDLQVRGATAPPINFDTDYVMVASDANRSLIHPAFDNNPRTLTIPSYATVPFEPGTMFTVVNRVNTVTIIASDATQYLSPSGATGNRTLSANGTATWLLLPTLEWNCFGPGLT
jgi:hypothetical protein